MQRVRFGGRTARVQTMLLYIILFSVGTCGILHAPLWSAMSGACVLALYFLLEDRGDKTAEFPARVWEIAQTTSSLAIATAASFTAYGAGLLSAQIWGL